MTSRALSAPSPWTAVDWTTFTHDAQIHGRALRYVDIGRGSPILLVHGLGGSWQTWLENIPALSAQHRVIAVDLPGFGRSQPLAKPLALDDLVDALITLLDELRIPTTAVIGHSMGGLVSMRLTHTHPQRVRRLVLLSSGGVHLSAARLAAIRYGFALFEALFAVPGLPGLIARQPQLRHLLLRGLVTDPDCLHPDLAAEVIPAMRAPGFTATVTAAARANHTVDPARITCPVLLIWGEKDRILPPESAAELADALTDARLEVIEGVGHCGMFESPTVFNSVVLHYLTDPQLRRTGSDRRVS